MIPGTIRELFTYVDQARGRLLEAAAGCDDAALDRPFEMGEGTLRKTLHHLWGAEQVWLSRWTGTRSPLDSPEGDQSDGVSVADLAKGFSATAAEREAWLQTQDAASMAGTFRYSRPFWMDPGPDLELPLGLSVVHVLNHFPHHGAQAVNMLKALGKPLPALDYIVMRRDGTPPAWPLDLATLRRYLAHSDWAFREVHEAAAQLPEAAQNRSFDIGPGSLRRVMRHMADATQWWIDNLEGRHDPYPALTEGGSWEDLWTCYDRVARRRDDQIAPLQDADLLRSVAVTPRPGVDRAFPLGIVMLQWCLHGTWHRAQALNMLRHAGGTVPSLDVNVWLRQGEPMVLG